MSVQEEEINDEQSFHSPVPTTDAGSVSSPPPLLPRRSARPYLRHNVVLNLAETHSLPTLWTPHSDNDDEEEPILRSPIPFTALLDVTNHPHWSDTEDDDGSEYDGDDESEDHEEDDNLTVYHLVESSENVLGAEPIPLITPLPQVEGDPTDYENDERGPRRRRAPQTTTAAPEGGMVSFEDAMDDDLDDDDDDEDDESSSSSSQGSAMSVQHSAVVQQQPHQNDGLAGPIRISRRLSLQNDALLNDAKERADAMMYFGHRRHSMGDIMLAA